MRRIWTAVLILTISKTMAQQDISVLPLQKGNDLSSIKNDWFLDDSKFNAEVCRSSDSKYLILENGLLRRTFRLSPNLTCVDFSNLITGEQLLRAVESEARVVIDGKSYNIGGLYGQKEKGYLKKEWIEKFTSKEGDFQFKHFEIKSIDPYLNWKPKPIKWAANKKQSTGKMVSFVFESNKRELAGITISINYELYDGIPLICKWLSIENKGNGFHKIDRVINEVLAIHEDESFVAGPSTEFRKPHGLYIESNYTFNNSMTARFSDQTTHWKPDSTYTSQVNYELKTPCLLEVYPEVGPGVIMSPGGKFKSIRTHELLLDSYDKERNGLAQRRMYRKIIPWATQNPIFMHLISIDEDVVKKAVDQCYDTGYEGIILSFGSGINMEDVSVKNIKYIKSLCDYAHSKGILLGGYSLFSSRSINEEEDVIDPKTGKANVHALFGHAPCLGSHWGLNYISHLKEFILKTGLDLFENDGPYAGDVCASTKHPGHKGLDDSQWSQMELQKQFYHWCNANDVYVNAPDWYFLDGTNKVALGYREVNFSLPRENQVILNRQNIYDGTWEKMPSMSWGFVPLTEYHGGGKAATLEPLSEHLYPYELLMMEYYGSGIQACYRGPRLYDTEETKNLVVNIIRRYKKYRDILNSDVIHLRRADGRDWDGILHVNTQVKEKGFAMLYNPLSTVINRTIRLPLYYTGLKKKVKIREKEGKSKSYRMDNNAVVKYNVSIPANGYTWLVIE